MFFCLFFFCCCFFFFFCFCFFVVVFLLLLFYFLLLFFLFRCVNICCGYLLVVPRGSASYKCTQNICFNGEIRKNINIFL